MPQASAEPFNPIYKFSNTWTYKFNSFSTFTSSCSKLKIYQWNADGICPHLVELCNQLINSDIDILAVQESKFRKTDKTPFIEGYATV